MTEFKMEEFVVEYTKATEAGDFTKVKDLILTVPVGTEIKAVEALLEHFNKEDTVLSNKEKEIKDLEVTKNYMEVLLTENAKAVDLEKTEEVESKESETAEVVQTTVDVVETPDEAPIEQDMEQVVDTDSKNNNEA